ncbi:MAG: type II secretion system ATPase GspE [Lysobacterales bacterium]
MRTIDVRPDILIPYAFSHRYGVAVVETDPLTVACHPKTRALGLLEIQRQYGSQFKLEELSEEEFNDLVSSLYEQGSYQAAQLMEDIGGNNELAYLAEVLNEPEDLMESQDDAPIIRLINALLTEAINEEASDIHIEPFEKRLSVRFRVDGTLREVLSPPIKVAPLLASRIKVMAKLDISEKRLPQDGRISLKVANHPVDVRVSTLPSGHGERVVMRLLDKKIGRLNLKTMGMAPQPLALLDELIHKPHGIILVTGPTGSGKTTSLYAALSRLNSAERNILTVEDPIEYDLDGVGQTQVNSKINMSFARGLRAILRQDPDVVMVGEIRDLETAQIAVQASLTGHLVLSTLHTNSGIGAITRLRDMGVESFLLSSSLLAVVAQRLVRVLCPHCKQPYTASVEQCKVMEVDSQKPPTLFKAEACSLCQQRGYMGRTGIYEVIAIDSTLQNMIHDNASEQILRNYAHPLYPSLRRDGWRQVLNGTTSLEEVLRVTKEG